MNLRKHLVASIYNKYLEVRGNNEQVKDLFDIVYDDKLTEKDFHKFLLDKRKHPVSDINNMEIKLNLYSFFTWFTRYSMYRDLSVNMVVNSSLKDSFIKI